MKSAQPQLVKTSQTEVLLWLGLAALLARLPLLVMSHGAVYDMESYARVARVMSEGGRLYGNPELSGRYPYLPAWALTLWGLGAAGQLFGVTQAWIYKLPALFADLAVTGLLYKISRRLIYSGSADAAREPFWMGRPFWIALAWAVNPLPLLISAGHGQFDSMAIAFVLLAAWYLEFSEHPQSDFASAVALGFAIAFKTWPVFFLPLFIRGFFTAKERLRYTALSLALPLLLLIPFALMCGLPGTLKALSYTGSQAFSLPEALRGFFFGAGASPDSFRAALDLWQILGMAALLFSWLAYVVGPWRFPLFAGLAFATLTLYVFAPGLAAQYLCWLLPFSVLVPGRLALRHSAVALVALILFYMFFAPEAFLRAGDWTPSQPPPWFFLIWAFLNLGLWLYFVREWISMGRLCRRPSGRLSFT